MSPFLRVVVMLGLYLSLRGYHSFDGDQAYRLPLLFHQQDARIYADDPFVRSFDAFNPHRGAILLLDIISRPLGVSMGLFVVFGLMFAGTCSGVERIARAVWAGRGPAVGLVAVGLLLAAKAGNIGTNQLFEAMVLDRLVALALFWVALARMVTRPNGDPAVAIAAMGLAAWVHPSLGLQLALLLSVSWVVWGAMTRHSQVSPQTAALRAGGIMIAVVPGLAFNLAGSAELMGSMPLEQFWTLSVELQSPQHMLPHLWRMPQWLAWGCYLTLAGISVWSTKPDTEIAGNSPAGTRFRLVSVLGVALAALAVGWILIEVGKNARVTVFQPFRLATAVRGIALILIAGRVLGLWRDDGWLGRTRAAVLATAFVGDWLLVVATAAELTVTAIKRVTIRRDLSALVYVMMLTAGFGFLARHDTESGQVPLVCAVVVGIAAGVPRRGGRLDALRSRLMARPRALRFVVTGCAWLVPMAALLAGAAMRVDPELGRFSVVRGLVNRCRFLETPSDDVERLAVWCREHTPPNARFIGPPGPKTFRLWSRRGLAFNRAGSPYHAAGLADWFARFQDHVDFHGTAAEFVKRYRTDRHRFESRYQEQGAQARAELAARQGATHVIAAAPVGEPDPDSPLVLLHREGRYAAYAVAPRFLAHRQR